MNAIMCRCVYVVMNVPCAAAFVCKVIEPVAASNFQAETVEEMTNNQE